MQSSITRHPIFDENTELYAYELLFQDNLDNIIKETDESSSSVIAESFFSSTGVDKLTEGKRAYLTFTEKLILDRIPLMCPLESVIVGIAPEIKDTKNVLEICKELHKKEYTIALNSFAFQKELIPLLPYVRIVRVNFEQDSIEKIKQIMELLEKNAPDAVLFAEKVNTQYEHKQAQDIGFKFFQGGFFRKPETIEKKEISTNLLNLVDIMKEISKTANDVNFDKVEALINHDMGISYKLLRYINSAYYKRATEISSIKQALLMLGTDEIRRFVSVIMMSSMSADKPTELLKTACIRARFCELLAKDNERKDAQALYTLGMFSLIDAILDQSMQDIMTQLPLATNLIDALANREGEMSAFLILLESYEDGNWDGVEDSAGSLSLNDENIPVLYMEACDWANPDDVIG
ncbi:MAG: HDOD domain-containing protein [Desulfobacterales bacterium]|nr:HDOD domain-containing protein [Desulfobacterales bacterium]MCP4159409.1 HDOD domain-containing protein [Deltaproteobacteria bacterium]